MTQIEFQIVELLKQGLSYLQIQEKLQVSSKTIATVKKEHFPQMEIYTHIHNVDTVPINSNTINDVSASKVSDYIEKNNKTDNLSNTKQLKTMITDNDDLQNATGSNLELEKYRIKLAHDLEIIRLNAGREDKKRELDIREQELQLERYKIEHAQNMDEEKHMLHRLKMAVKSCIDAEYEKEVIEILLQEAITLNSEFEKYCLGNKINFQGTDSQIILERIIANLADYLDRYDEDESETTMLIMDMNFRQLTKWSTFKSI